MNALTSNIRKARVQDAQALSEIYNHYIGKATMDTELRSAPYFHAIIDNLPDHEAILVIEDECGILGWGTVKKYSMKEGYRYAAETSVFLDPDQKGKGHGKKLKMAIIQKAKDLGYQHLVAKIWASNQQSIRYNLKLGYKIVGTQEKIGFINGKWIDVVILQYIFNSGKDPQVDY